MSTRHYDHTIGGQGVATGLPVRRGSHLYEHRPDARYPDLIDLGVHPSQHQFTERPYSRLPYLPITFIQEPEIANPDRPGTGNLTRRQYFVIKLGQPLMAAQNRDRSIGVFMDDGTGDAEVKSRQFVDPEKLKDNGTPVGFYDKGRYQLKKSENNNASDDAPKVITTDEWENLDSGDVSGTDDQDDYKEVTKADPVSIDRYQALPDAKKEGFRTVYEDLEDTNDEIATGGVDMYAKTEKELFGSSDRVEHVRVDADEFYFGNATKRAGFIYPSTGGAERTMFYNQVDQEAGVMLPVDDSGNPRTVQPIGSVTDVSADNLGAYGNSAVHMEAKPTIGVSHADLEQAQSHKYHHFSTGTDAVQPAKTGELLLPFINIEALETAINERTELNYGGDPASTGTTGSFNFTDQTEGRSGIKTGIYNESDIGNVNKISLLTERDAGYANLYYNLAAPFLVTDKVPRLQDQVKPDLFGNYTLAHNGAFSNNSPSFGTLNDGDANVNGEVDMDALGLSGHVIGSVQEVYDSIDQGRVDLSQLRVNPIFQNRITDADAARNLTNEGYRRVGGSADTGGLDQLLADTAFMALGGANSNWLSELLPELDGLGQDVSQILKELVTAGAFGEVKVAFDTTGL